jgi:hypothetical protein
MNEEKNTSKSNIGQAEQKTQGQITQANHQVSVLKSVSDFDGINQEITYAFLCKKTEKLTMAIYLVTGFLSDNEPIKWNIREAGLAVLSGVSVLGNSVVSEMSQRIKKIMSDTEKVVSLLEISATAGFISEMNLSILKEEYLSLIQTLGTRKNGGLHESFVFARDFFAVRGNPNREKENFYKGHIKDTENISDKISSQDASLSLSALPSDGVANPLRNISSVVRSPVVPDADTRFRYPISHMGITNFTPKKAEKESRKDNIIRLIKEKGKGEELSIKDITSRFDNCGEKTIQRELAALVVSGVLKKTGDRRWSKYSLA